MTAPAPVGDFVWYLGYGSNMNPAVLTGRRGVKPVESFPCRVPGYVLASDVRGIPWVEPAFFSVMKRVSNEQVELHGVAHKITLKDYAQIRATEGGNGHPTLGYQDEHLKVVFYDGREVDALTLKVSARSSHPGYVVSRRYLGLCVAGAKHFSLDANYVNWLSSLPTYKRKPLQWLGAIVMFLTVGPIIIPPIVFTLLLRKTTGIKLLITAEFLFYASNTIWFIHDYALRFIFGNGGLLTVACAASAQKKPSPAL